MIRSVATLAGTDVFEVELAAPGGAVARILTLGATLRDLVVPGAAGLPTRVVLGLERVEDYLDNPAYLGVTAGRHANRIRAGRFVLDGREHRLTLNERGRTHLHGGATGFSRRPWRLVEADEHSAALALTSPDGEEGYPGTVEARVVYQLIAPATVRIEMTATTDAPTIVNLAHHSYFALEPGAAVRDHLLEVAASRYTPVDADLLPTGEIAPVEGTVYDFRAPRRVGSAAPLDLNFALDRAAGAGADLLRAARVFAPATGLALEVWTTAPALQVYDGGYLAADGPPGLDGARPFPNAGLCLEPQLFPDGPSHPAFPSPVLRPGETFRQVTEYRLSAR
jgi:aldose 1-epimerase